MRISDWSSDVCSSDLTVPLAASAKARQHRQDEEEKDDEADEHQPPEIALVGAVAFLRGGGLRARGRLLGRKLDLLGDRVDASLDTAGIISGLELRCHHVADDPARQRVGQDRFEPIADRDIHPPLVRRDQEDDAVILPLAADPPGTAELVAIIADVMAFEAADGRDDELVPGLFLEIEKLRVERGFLGRRDDAGLIDDGMARQLRKGLREAGGRQQYPGERRHHHKESLCKTAYERGEGHDNDPIAPNRPSAPHSRSASPPDKASSAWRRERSWRR